jgi:hypothetical protein
MDPSPVKYIHNVIVVSKFPVVARVGIFASLIYFLYKKGKCLLLNCSSFGFLLLYFKLLENPWNMLKLSRDSTVLETFVSSVDTLA